MKVHRFEPHSSLAPFVRTFEVIETNDGAARTLMPETGLILSFRYSGSATLLEGQSERRVPDCAATGLRSTARRMRTSSEGGMVLVKFREGGATGLVDLPLHRLFGETVALDELVHPAQVRATLARVRDARSHPERVRALESFLLEQRARSEWAVDPLVEAALRAIEAAATSIRVGPLARELGLSLDAFEKRFRSRVGASPKQFASTLRLRRAVESHRHAATLTRVALEAGYYDQAHFVRQFVAATGIAPRRFLASTEYCL